MESPIEQVITVSPEAAVATVYTAEIEAADGEAVVENNARSVLVSPTGRKRKVLALAGAPGYDFSFLSRALGRDPGLEFDSIVRKGQNEAGQHTFLVQAGAGRAAALTSGFPATREALYGYDAVILANVEGDFFGRAQLAMAADFVAVRGGGLIALGGRSFGQRGLIGTPLEEALPVELNDRRGGLARAAADAEGAPVPNAVMLTAEGQAHPAMRIGATAEETSKRWAAPPAAGRKRRRRRATAGSDDSRRHDGHERCALPDHCGAALRTRPDDGVRRRSVMAVAHAGSRRRSHLRALLASGGAMARHLRARSRFGRRPVRRRAGPSGADRGRGARRGVRAGQRRHDDGDCRGSGRQRSARAPARPRGSRPFHRPDDAGRGRPVPGAGRGAPRRCGRSDRSTRGSMSAGSIASSPIRASTRDSFAAWPADREASTFMPARPAACRRCCSRRRHTRSSPNAATSGTSPGPSRSSSRCSRPNGSCAAGGGCGESAPCVRGRASFSGRGRLPRPIGMRWW